MTIDLADEVAADAADHRDLDLSVADAQAIKQCLLVGVKDGTIGDSAFAMANDLAMAFQLLDDAVFRRSEHERALTKVVPENFAMRNHLTVSKQ